MAYGESIGHVIDDVTLHRKLKIVTSVCMVWTPSRPSGKRWWHCTLDRLRVSTNIIL